LKLQKEKGEGGL